MSDGLTRRAMVEHVLGAWVWASLAALARGGEALAQGDARGRAWWAGVARLCAEARDGTREPAVWQERVEEAVRALGVAELMASLPPERLAAAARAGPPRGARVEVMRPPAGVAAREALSFRRRLFAVGAGRAVVPHGHVSVASAFVMLRGEGRMVHYDRSAGPPGRSLLTPTVDRGLAPGDCTTISDARDNVHWLRAGEVGALLMNVSVEVPASGRFGAGGRGRVYLDPTVAERDGGAIVAPHMSYAEATARFG